MVRLEVGARSDHWPAIDAEVTPYIAEDFPKLFTKAKCKVRVLGAERTFWEKATALHAWHQSVKTAVPDRRSRHYYDVVRLYEQEIGKRAIKDLKLLAEVARHKSLFFPATSAHYELAKPGTLKLAPPAEQIEMLRSDYQSMAEMFFATPPPYEHLLDVLRQMERVING
ncbi:MAG TPA: nucleotidyl transferase AbiEii/AbiGii toxin family protein [Phycisphaerae bacterium]|nr:nucleotidyl transferase AbiEii/AbiGii toxin family protein [Phycisphaerae bacterium]